VSQARADAFAPLRRPVFRSIWLASLVSNLGTWMQNVGAAWLMTSLAPSPLFVSLVQAASNLPLFLLALPAGALADVVDRRRLLLVALSWLALASAGLGALALTGWATPGALLALTFAIGLGSAFAAPPFQAIVPELVPREEVTAAAGLNAISMNAGRAVGPALGGVVVATAGAGATFLLNAGSFAAVLVAIGRWRRPRPETKLPPEELFGAMRAGLRFVRHSGALQTVLWRTGAFALPASAIWALLPLYARQDLGLGAAGYGGLLGCFGAGAVVSGVLLPGLRVRLGAEGSTTAAGFVFGAAALGLGLRPALAPAGVALFAAGGAWLTVLSTMNASAQLVIPPWVRARALAIYLIVLFGGLALGSALWGAAAEALGVTRTLALAGVAVAAGRIAIWHRRLPEGEGPDLTPAPRWPDPELAIAVEADRGPVLVTVEYVIDPAQAAEFARAMQALRVIRLRDGALRWGLWADTTTPGRYLESFVVESWLEHLRQHERITAADRLQQALAHGFHRGPEPPRVTHYVAEPLPPES
jgi:MFS family permease